jgi:hypothetical protein
LTREGPDPERKANSRKQKRGVSRFPGVAGFPGDGERVPFIGPRVERGFGAAQDEDAIGRNVAVRAFTERDDQDDGTPQGAPAGVHQKLEAPDRTARHHADHPSLDKLPFDLIDLRLLETGVAANARMARTAGETIGVLLDVLGWRGSDLAGPPESQQPSG